MSEPLLTHKALAALLGVSETTVKSYRRKFPGCIPVASEGKPIRFTASAAEVAIRIRDLFSSGMSVKEVRLRLAAEFSWVSPEIPRTGREAAAAPELTLGVSNMAKSMVTMAQQQSVMVKRMQSIEGLLGELGLKGADVEALRAANAQAARRKEERLETRLDRLDAVTQGLAESLASLAGDLERFLGERAKLAGEWQKRDTALPSEERVSTETTSAPEARRSARVITLRPGLARPDVDYIADPAAPMGGRFPEEMAPRTPLEPPRHFFSLPLVARGTHGQYLSADGRPRGRFCLNDLKALLIYGFTPPAHYALQWEPHGQGWWLDLRQPQQENSRTLQFLLMEVPGRPEGNVVEILQLQENGQPVHPSAVTRILDSFSE